MWEVVIVNNVEGYSLEDLEVLVTNKINSCFPVGEKVHDIVSDKNGLRLITDPFDIGSFKFKFIKLQTL